MEDGTFIYPVELFSQREEEEEGQREREGRREGEREKGRTVSTRSFTPMIDARWAFLQLADALLLDLTSSSSSSSSLPSRLPSPLIRLQTRSLRR